MRRDKSGELVVHDTTSFLSDLYTKSESACGQNDNEGVDGAEEGEDKEEEEGERKGSWKSYRSHSSKGPAQHQSLLPQPLLPMTLHLMSVQLVLCPRSHQVTKKLYLHGVPLLHPKYLSRLGQNPLHLLAHLRRKSPHPWVVCSSHQKHCWLSTLLSTPSSPSLILRLGQPKLDHYTACHKLIHQLSQSQ